MLPSSGARGGRLTLPLSRLRLDLGDLPKANRRLLRRHERLGWLSSVGFIVSYALVDHLTEILLPSSHHTIARTFLVAVLSLSTTLVMTRLLLSQAARQIRQEEATRAAREEAARLQGALLAARTMQHHLRNQLALTAGYSELLANDRRLPAALHAHAREAVAGVKAATETLDKLQRLTRLEEDSSLAGLPRVLDLERSAS